MGQNRRKQITTLAKKRKEKYTDDVGAEDRNSEKYSVGGKIEGKN